MTQSLARSKARRARIRLALRHTALELGKTRIALASIKRQMGEAEERSARLDRQERSLQARLRTSRQQLLHLMQVRFMLGSKQRLRFLLESGSVGRLDRLLGEWRWIDREATESLRRTQHLAVRLTRSQQVVSHLLYVLRAMRAARERTLVILGSDRARRAALLYALSNRVSERELRLHAVRRHYRELATLLARLSAQPAIPENQSNAIEFVPFGRLRGRLPWPVRGTIVRGFGSAEAGGLLLSHGLWIATHPGARVRAVAHGQVVFSGWLPHFGLLLIVSQGHGYYTVYARNALLYDQVGDWVNGGDPIGRVSQGRDAELYFQIRQGVQPIDPAPWLTPGG
jgi:septal ring factor EnvC (AmiA/AmiB activator)